MVWEIPAAGLYRDVHDFGGTLLNANGAAGLDCLFPLAGVTVDNAGNICGTGYEGGVYGGGMVWTLGPTLESVSVSPLSITGGTSISGHVTLSHAAPPGGVTLSLESSSSSATVPISVTIAAGAAEATFPLETVSVESRTTIRITAGYAGASHSATLTIMPAKLVSVILGPTAVVGGAASTGTVTLSGLAGKFGAIVKLASNSKLAKLPASVKILAGQMSATFTIDTAAVDSAKRATIDAAFGGVTKTAVLSISQ